MNIWLSKTRYVNGLQCKKLLWYIYHDPQAIPKPDAATQILFEQGHLVGNYAKKLFPTGEQVDHTGTFEGGLRTTRELICRRVPIFEAALIYKHCYARADILEPVADDEWNLIEVKSSTELKDINYHDIGFQYYLYSGAGLKIDKCYLMCIDNAYIRKGEIEPRKLFKKIDVTDKIKTTYIQTIEDNVTEMIKSIRAETYTEIDIGAHCNKPYDCPLIDKCWSFLPEHNVTELYSFREKYDLLDNGITSIYDLPVGIALTDKQMIQIEATKSKRPFIDKESIRKFLNSLEYPIYCLDFETMSVAIPPFNKARPYQNIPFQFSIHVIQKMNSDTKFHSYLANTRNNFAPELVQALKVIGPEGTVLAYNMSFEKQVLKVLTELSPKDTEWLESIANRLRDLIEPFRTFSYYHPDQHGSCSLKVILPVLVGKSYNDMEIGEGGMASIKYYLTHFRDSDKEEKEKVRNALLEYCKLDTEGMVDILLKLQEISN